MARDSMRAAYRIAEAQVGYGNPLFDGDVPLPPPGRKPRIMSLRQWLGAVLAATPREGAGLDERHGDDEISGSGSATPWPQGQGGWNGRG